MHKVDKNSNSNKDERKSERLILERIVTALETQVKDFKYVMNA